MAVTLSSPKKSVVSSWLSLLSQPVAIYSLVALRILFGLTMLWEAYRYLNNNWLSRYWIKPPFHFTYEGFHWIQPWPGDGMYYHFYALGLLAICITLGLVYRLSSVLFFLGFTYFFLLEQARYMNHLYLVVLLSFLMIFLPANRYFSLDAKLFPAIKSVQVPRWSLLLIQIQLGLVYFFGGVAKINADWLRGEPMRMWLANKTDFPIIGSLFTQEWMVYFFSYSGLMIDLLAFPLLAFRKTRPYMFLALLFFHFINDRLFHIGIFPWFAIGLTTIFFFPNWPQQVYRQLKRQPALVIGTALLSLGLARYFHGSAELLPLAVGALAGMLLATSFSTKNSREFTLATTFSPKPRYQAWIVTGFTVWFFIQIALPLRHFFIPGNVSWTEEGHRFAWHMKLRSKVGRAILLTHDPSNGKQEVIPVQKFLTRWQYQKMTTRPYLLRQFAQFLEQKYPDKEIRAIVECSLNGRSQQLLVDPGVNLTTIRYRDWQHHSWIRPLKEQPLSAAKTK